jgi:hypothetical protein
MMTDENPKNDVRFNCETCSFTCCKKSNFNTHLHTAKHKRMTKDDEKIKKDAKAYICDCGKQYKYRQGLHVHKTKCTPKNETTDTTAHATTNTNDPLIIQLLARNTELMEMLIAQNKEIQKAPPTSTTINQTTNNNNNQRFNINLFLNETCKDAINFSDFVKNIQISYEDLENNAQLGFVNGISKIFLDNLKQLDVNERPIHCTDVKRETMYIKDENEWTKQSDDEKLQKAIQTVSYRSMGKLAEWKQENPDYKDANSEFSQKCIDIQRQTLAGSDRGVYYPKVIHALAREVVVEK